MITAKIPRLAQSRQTRKSQHEKIVQQRPLAGFCGWSAKVMDTEIAALHLGGEQNNRKSAVLGAALARVGGGCAAQALSGLMSRTEIAEEQSIVCPVAAPAAEQPLNDQPPLVSLRAALFDPAQYLPMACIAVMGVAVVLDIEAERMDISYDGAKLIVHLGQVDTDSSRRLAQVSLGREVRVVGRLKKQQRRTFLQAHSLEPANNFAGTTVPVFG